MKAQKQKRKPGRPPLEGGGIRRMMVSLDLDRVETAKKLGAGNVSAGIRKALAKAG